MKRLHRIVVLLFIALAAESCGYGNHSSKTVTGISVQPQGPTAYSSMAPPQNQVVFTANLVYSDDSTAPLTSGVKWTYDFAPWVSLSGNTATCTRPADTVLGIPTSSQINASTTVNGTSYTNLSLLYCL